MTLQGQLDLCFYIRIHILKFSRSISYVRFDGSMSAKRRQETIARFSVPLEDDESPAQILTQAPAPAPATQSGRSTRQRRKTNRNNPTSDVVDLVADDDADDDFVMPADDGDDDDDSFIVDDSDDERPKKKAKGKGKAKTNGKRKAAPKSDYRDNLRDGVNPKVMLISLKAGALGLNLTVANNVYL